MTQKTYQKLFALSREVKLFDSIGYLLEWDQETFMPEDAISVRAEQVELIAALVHKKRTAKSFASLLGEMIDLDSGKLLAHGLGEKEKSALKQWRRDYRLAKALPNRFVKQFAKLTSEAVAIWGVAKKNNDFKSYAPYLKKIVEMSRKKADLLGFDVHPYDALVDTYEPAMRTAILDPLFSSLKEKIGDLYSSILQAEPVDNSILHGDFCATKQLEFGRMLLSEMGYDLKKGRLDLSNHPFSTSLHPSDSRVTTRIHTSSLFDSISAVLHEGGHSLYEMGLMPEYYGSPLCESVSLGIHESQSRLWETRIGQSRAFWSYYLPKLKECFAPKLDSVHLDDFYRAINAVKPNLIRVESDEVTYSLHVILRYELEKQLIEGSLSVKELPEAWNALSQKYLKITPPTIAQGCMQDIHWAMGGFGYFPTYTLGNLYAAQFFATFAAEHPDWEKRVAQGELLFLKEWLNEHIHKHGRRFSATELVEQISGQSLSTEPYLAYLTDKYQKIYAHRT